MRPVTFHYKGQYVDGSQPLEFGLIAEEVAETFPELVAYDKNGQPETVKYRLLSVLLLNELKKQDQTNKDQSKSLADLQEVKRELEVLKSQIAEIKGE